MSNWKERYHARKKKDGTLAIDGSTSSFLRMRFVDTMTNDVVADIVLPITVADSLATILPQNLEAIREALKKGVIKADTVTKKATTETNYIG